MLLDAGGVFLLPDHDRIRGAFKRAEHDVDAALLDAAHYRAATRFTTDLDVERDWQGCWERYLDTYVDACGVVADEAREVHRHVDSEFADAALWVQEAPGCRTGLAALAATGVTLGVVSNADGLVASRLQEHELLQVGPGPGVDVACVIDSGVVGVMKPAARIFAIALEAIEVAAADAWYVGDMPAIDVVGAQRAGLRPLVIDPLGLHESEEYTAVASLADVAALVDRA